MNAEVFFDSNVLLYLLSADPSKADKAESLMRAGGVISVQVLNEVANVARRKLRMPWDEVTEVLGVVRALCTTQPLTVESHGLGLKIAERHGLSIYDAMILGSALSAGCRTVFSEDMHHGLLIEGRLRIQNPFRPTRSRAP